MCVKYLSTHKNEITMKLFLRSLLWKFLVDFKASKLSQLGDFVFCCPLKGSYFSSVDLGMAVRIRLREVSAYGKYPLAEARLY